MQATLCGCACLDWLGGTGCPGSVRRGVRAVASPQQEEVLSTHLRRELQQYGVVAEVVIRLDTAWVKFANISTTAEVGACACCLSKITAVELNHNIPEHAGGPHHVGQQQQFSDREMQQPSSLTSFLQDALLRKDF